MTNISFRLYIPNFFRIKIYSSDTCNETLLNIHLLRLGKKYAQGARISCSPPAPPRRGRRRPAISAAPSRRAAVFVFHCFTAVLILHPSRPLLTLGASSGRGSPLTPRLYLHLHISHRLLVAISFLGDRGGSAPARRAHAKDGLSIFYLILHIYFFERHASFENRSWL